MFYWVRIDFLKVWYLKRLYNSYGPQPKHENFVTARLKSMHNIQVLKNLGNQWINVTKKYVDTIRSYDKY